jgi:hypothetical protein
MDRNLGTGESNAHASDRRCVAVQHGSNGKARAVRWADRYWSPLDLPAAAAATAAVALPPEGIRRVCLNHDLTALRATRTNMIQRRLHR